MEVFYICIVQYIFLLENDTFGGTIVTNVHIIPGEIFVCFVRIIHGQTVHLHAVEREGKKLISVRSDLEEIDPRE